LTREDGKGKLHKGAVCFLVFGAGNGRHEERFWEEDCTQTDGFGGLVGLLGMVWEGDCDKTYVVGGEDGKYVGLTGPADYGGGDRDCQLPRDDQPVWIYDCLSG